MKKTLAILMALVMSVTFLAACRDEPVPEIIDEPDVIVIPDIEDEPEDVDEEEIDVLDFPLFMQVTGVIVDIEEAYDFSPALVKIMLPVIVEDDTEEPLEDDAEYADTEDGYEGEAEDVDEIKPPADCDEELLADDAEETGDAEFVELEDAELVELEYVFGDNIVYFLITDETIFPFSDELEIGQTVTGWYYAYGMMPAIYPPEYAVSVLVAGAPEGVIVYVDEFEIGSEYDEFLWWISSDGYFAFAITEDTLVILPSGESYYGDFDGLNLVVVYIPGDEGSVTVVTVIVMNAPGDVLEDAEEESEED